MIKNKILYVVATLFWLCTTHANANTFNFAGDFSSLTSSSSDGQLIQNFSNSSATSFQGIYLGKDADGNLVNATTYQSYYSAPQPTVVNVYSLGAPTPNYQTTNYSYFTASFATPGLYSLTLNQGSGDPVGSIYVTRTNTLAYTGVGLTNLYAFSDDSGGISSTAPWTIYYNQPDSTCTSAQFLVYEYGGSVSSLTGTFQISGPGSIASTCAALGPSIADTQQSLVSTASVLQGTFTLQNAVMVNGFTYDCALFDKNGICVSAGGRNTTVQSQGINNTNGLLIASYRLNKNNSRIGAWVDQNLSTSGPGTVQLNNSTPMIGLFGVWSQRPDGVGAEVKVSAAYGQKDTTITRQVIGTSEAGSGGSQLISQGAQVVGKYGFAVMPDVVVSPYVGVRYTQNNMGGYTEGTSSAVTAPLTYSALNTNATTALAGAEARYRGIPKTTLFTSAGVETDTNTSNGTYSATGVAGLTPVNFNPNPVRTRPTATLGAFYDIVKNQRIGITGIYRQESYQAISTTTVMATYTIGL
jgi:Autotransporter beta-domain